MRRIRRFAAKTAACMFVAAALIPSMKPAYALSYTVTYSGPNPLTQLGNQLSPPSIYDTLSIQALSGTFGAGK